MAKYRLSFIVESDKDPSELLDNLDEVANERRLFGDVDEDSPSVESLD